MVLFFLRVSLQVARAAAYVLEGQDKGDPNTWVTVNLQNWLELDFIPCRVRITGGPVASQTFTLTFPHITGTTPGFEDLYNFVASPNVVVLSAPTLSSPTNADWSYSFTVQVTNSSTATIQFLARLAAGSHLHPGNSLQLGGSPQSMGNLQIAKPIADPGAPDLAIKKTGPTLAPQGGLITYTLAYTNQAADPTKVATGVQISDILPPGITVQTNTLGANANFSGNTIFWDLTNVATHAAGQISFQVQVTAPVGRVLTNFSQILSSQTDANYADNTSTWSTTVTVAEDPPGCSVPNGGTGNSSQGGINFDLALAHLGDTVPLFATLEMTTNACRAINVFGTIYIARGPLTNFLENATLNPAESISCPGNALCQPGPYQVPITPDLIGAGVGTPLGTVPGLAGTVRAVENGIGTVLNGNVSAQLSEFHSTTILIVTPCIQVFATCDLPTGQGCFSAETPVRFRGYVTNCGDITLTNVMVMDDQVGALQLFGPTNGLPLTNNVTLSPGAYAVFSNSFLPTLQAICAGRATNVVTASGTDTTTIGGPRASVSNSAAGVCEICVHPAVVVTKACPPGALAYGGVLTFTGRVINTGNITLTNLTIVNDRLLTNGSSLVASFPALAPGEFKTFSGSYLVPTNVCSVTDTLTAQGTTRCGGAGVANTTSTTCALTNPPGLALTQDCPSPPPAPGQLFVFTGTVTNLGNVAVTNLVIVNNHPTNNTPVTMVARLEPGEGRNFSGSYLVPLSTCILSDTLTAAGFGVCGAVVTTRVTRTCAAAGIQDPVIICSSNLVLAADAGQCSRSNVTFFVKASDNCGFTNLVSSTASGSTFPVGTTTVTNTATDASGNTASCTFTVTVIDNQKPVITCSSNLGLPTDAGRCNRSNVTFTVSATDNCGVANLVSSPPSGSTFPLGVTTVASTATDASGNRSSCTFTVTVRDQELPGITCPPDLTTNTALGATTVTNIALGTLVTSDNCAVAGFSNNAPSILPVGTNIVLWTVTDINGNSSSCQQRVVVRACSGILNATPFVNLTTCPKRPVLFETTASSPEPIIYQWKFNGQPMAGQTNRSLALPSVDASRAGVYTLEVRTECALVTLTAALTVLAAPDSSPTAYTNTSSIIIPENGEATPYGSALTPQCVPGVVRNLTVTIFGFSHRYPADVSMVLASPDGRQVKLMSGAGGTESVLGGGVDLTFSDAAPNPLPETDLIVSGTYLPTDYLPGFALSPPATGPYLTNLSAFIGTDPNGPWRLFVFDSVQLDGGNISSWSLNLEWQEKAIYLQNPSVLASGGFRVEVVGLTGIPTIIERSSNLVTWLPMATNVYSISPGVFIDPAPLSSRRLYRALQP